MYTAKQLLVAHVLISYKPFARAEYLEQLKMGAAYSPTDPTIASLAQCRLVKIKAGGQIQPDREAILKVIRQYKRPQCPGRLHHLGFDWNPQGLEASEQTP